MAVLAARISANPSAHARPATTNVPRLIVLLSFAAPVSAEAILLIGELKASKFVGKENFAGKLK